jgi:tetratricopeptide (TPR) repeat protein
VEGIVNKLGIEYPVLIDEENKLYGEFGLFIFPATGIIDQGGKFAFEYASYGADFSQIVMDKAKVMLGLLSEADFKKSTEKKPIVELTENEKGAERNLQMAKVLLDRGFGSKAIPKVEKAIELNPGLLEARLLAGELYVEEGKFAEARQHLEIVLAANPRSNEAKVGLASVMIAEGDLDGAEAELKKAITLNPDPTFALYRLGQVYEKKGQTQKAMETYRNALEKILKK